MTINSNCITITTIDQAHAITHAGVFHSDEVMATAFLFKAMGDLSVARVNKVPEDLPLTTLVYDIGGGRFDHHQRGGNGARENEVKYSSFGLLWRAYGIDFLQSRTENPQLVWRLIDESLVQTVDATDNGQLQPIALGYQNYGIGRAISAFNPTWDEASDFDGAFLKAVAFAEVIFDQALREACSKAKAQSDIEEAIAASEGPILLLDKFMPWQEFVDQSRNPKSDGLLYICFPGARGGFTLQCIPKKGEQMSQRKSLPKAWAGLQADKLPEVSGVADAIFCHPARFICAAQSLEGALTMADLAINEPE